MVDVNFVFNYLVVVTIISILFYKWATRNNNFFIKRGIPALKPSFLLGNSGEFFMKRIEWEDFVKRLYFSFPDEK